MVVISSWYCVADIVGKKEMVTVTLQNCIVLHFVKHHLQSIIPAAKRNHFCICEEYLHFFKQTFAYCKTEALLPSALLVVKQIHIAYNDWRNCSKAGLWLKWQIVYLRCVHYRLITDLLYFQHSRSLSSHGEN